MCETTTLGRNGGDSVVGSQPPDVRFTLLEIISCIADAAEAKELEAKGPDVAQEAQRIFVDSISKAIALLLQLANGDDIEVLARVIGFAGDELRAILAECNFDPLLSENQIQDYAVDVGLGVPPGRERGDVIWLYPGQPAKVFPLAQAHRQPHGVLGAVKIRSSFARRGLDQLQSVWFYPGQEWWPRVVELVNRGPEPIDLHLGSDRPDHRPVQIVMFPIVTAEQRARLWTRRNGHTNRSNHGLLGPAPNTERFRKEVLDKDK